MKNVYSTLDSYQAGFLVLRGHSPTLSAQGNKIAFLFESTKALHKDLTDYNAGASVEASRFAMTIKALKSQIYGLRMNNGKRYEKKKEAGG
jgi:hypothetical protein